MGVGLVNPSLAAEQILNTVAWFNEVGGWDGIFKCHQLSISRELFLSLAKHTAR